MYWKINDEAKYVGVCAYEVALKIQTSHPVGNRFYEIPIDSGDTHSQSVIIMSSLFYLFHLKIWQLSLSG